MTKARAYYTLLINDKAIDSLWANRWAPQFGAYTKKEVEAESRDAYGDIPSRFKKIIRTDDDLTTSVQTAVKKLNAVIYHSER